MIRKKLAMVCVMTLSIMCNAKALLITRFLVHNDTSQDLIVDINSLNLDAKYWKRPDQYIKQEEFMPHTPISHPIRATPLPNNKVMIKPNETGWIASISRDEGIKSGKSYTVVAKIPIPPSADLPQLPIAKDATNALVNLIAKIEGKPIGSRMYHAVSIDGDDPKPVGPHKVGQYYDDTDVHRLITFTAQGKQYLVTYGAVSCGIYDCLLFTISSAQ